MTRCHGFDDWMLRYTGRLSGGLILLAMLCFNSHVRAENPGIAYRAGPEDMIELQMSTAVVIQGHEDFPGEPASYVRVAQPLYWSAVQGGRLLVPVTIRFKGLANSYCRVLTQMRGHAEVVLVDVPEQVNYDACRGFDSVRYLDINGDGALDIVASLSVKSNTFNSYVTEQAVFLSGADNPSGYCYSDAASRNLKPADMQSESKIARALEQERRRLGGAKFEWVSPPKG